MTENAEAIIDWINLPAGMQSVSLWESVHDGELQSVQSDVLARWLQVKVAVGYLVSFHAMPGDLTFTFYLEGVQSVRVLRYTPWPVHLSLPSGLAWEEQRRQTAEHRRKWRKNPTLGRRLRPQ
jgi:hypothetical protein